MKYFIYCRKSSESEDRQILSIDSQYEELRKAFADRPAIEIVEVLKESFSAKAPGRAVFNSMVQRIERGEADGIIAWHPDRLARNSVDGGRIIYLLDSKVLKDLKFATFTFENNSQGKFMLSIVFGYSKYYVDSLSENVKRGNRAKLARGWIPNHAPLGYRNDAATSTVVVDEERFPLVRRIFDRVMTGGTSVRAVALESRDWGLRTPKRKRRGENYLAISAVHRILTNPFYAGAISWGGETHPGAHKPMVTWDEFNRVQHILRRSNSGPTPSKAPSFAYTGLIRCGECGLMITAEQKINRYGYRYAYYHCTKKRLDYRCHQPYMSADRVEECFANFLAEHTVPEQHHAWALERIRAERAGDDLSAQQQHMRLQEALANTRRALTNLTTLRVREQIDDEEFANHRKRLQEEGLELEQRLHSSITATEWIEPAEALIWFSARALEWFRGADGPTRRRIVQSVGSNFIMTDKMISIDARKPFARFRKNSTRSDLCAGQNDFRNLFMKKDLEVLETTAQIVALKKEYEEKQLKLAA